MEIYEQNKISKQCNDLILQVKLSYTFIWHTIHLAKENPSRCAMTS